MRRLQVSLRFFVFVAKAGIQAGCFPSCPHDTRTDAIDVTSLRLKHAPSNIDEGEHPDPESSKFPPNTCGNDGFRLGDLR